MSLDLNERVARYLAKVPPAIEGQRGHDQTFYVACQLFHGFGLSEAETYQWLLQYNARCQPPWSEKDLAHKAQQASVQNDHQKPRGHLLGNGSVPPLNGHEYTPPKSFRAPPPARRIDPATCIENFLKGFRCSESDLYDASPIKPSEDFTQDASSLVFQLFKPGELVNFVTTYKLNDTKDGGVKAVPHSYGDSVERDELIKEWNSVGGPPESECGGWMRMNPMDDNGITDKNVTVHRHILLEFDGIPLDLQMSLLAKLPLPISCILTSGGRSIHAWVRSDSIDAVDYRDTASMLLRILDRFGLDGKNRNPSRLSRLPGVIRKIGATGDGRQRLLYLNPTPRQKAIL